MTADRISATGLAVLATQPVNIVIVAGSAPTSRRRRARPSRGDRERRPRAHRDHRRAQPTTLAGIAQDADDVCATAASMLVAPGIARQRRRQANGAAGRAAAGVCRGAGRRQARDARAAHQPDEQGCRGRRPDASYTPAREQKQLLQQPHPGAVPTISASGRARHHDRHRAVPPDQRAPHRRLRQGRRAHRRRTRTSAGSTTPACARRCKATLDGFLSQMVLDEMLDRATSST